MVCLENYAVVIKHSSRPSISEKLQFLARLLCNTLGYYLHVVISDKLNRLSVFFSSWSVKTSICVARNACSDLLSYKTLIQLYIYSQYRKMCSDYFHLIQSHTFERSPAFYDQNIPRTSAGREKIGSIGSRYLPVISALTNLMSDWVKEMIHRST